MNRALVFGLGRLGQALFIGVNVVNIAAVGEYITRINPTPEMMQ